jgi:hypothetical protein
LIYEQEGIMRDLHILRLSGGEIVRCADIDEAKVKAISDVDVNFEPLLEITPQGGGPMLTLKFDKASQDWIPES